MLVHSRKATVDNFGRSAMNDEQKGIGAGLSPKFDTAVWAACLAVAFLVPDGYPQFVAFSVLSLCSFASILRVCQRDP
jgi:hypothetical protein